MVRISTCSWLLFSKKCNVYHRMFNALPSSRLWDICVTLSRSGFELWLKWAFAYCFCIFSSYILYVLTLSFTTLPARLSLLNPQSWVSVLYDLGSRFWDRASCVAQATPKHFSSLAHVAPPCPLQLSGHVLLPLLPWHHVCALDYILFVTQPIA